jgi:hypothetical protein
LLHTRRLCCSRTASAAPLAAAIAAGRAAVIRRKYRNTPHKARRFKAYRKLFYIHSLTNRHTAHFKRTALLRCVASYVFTQFPLDPGDTMTGYDVGSDSDSE